MPKEITTGTVTGPVVTAPESQARPTREDSSSDTKLQRSVPSKQGRSVQWIIGLMLPPRSRRMEPVTAATPTPVPMAKTKAKRHHGSAKSLASNLW